MIAKARTVVNWHLEDERPRHTRYDRDLDRKRIVTDSGKVIGVIEYRLPPPVQRCDRGYATIYDMWVAQFGPDPFWMGDHFSVKGNDPEDVARRVVERWERRNKRRPARVVPEQEVV